MRVALALAALAAFGVTTGVEAVGRADAASSVESGWWTSAPVAFAPDAPDDQLLVQGGPNPSQPVAYAGISFTLALGEVPEKLVLLVASNSATTPAATVALCQLGSAAHAASGDPAADGPPFDCMTAVEAAPSADGTSYEFDVARLAKESSLDVAVLPTQPTDRVVLAKPDVDALQSRTAGSVATGESTTDPGIPAGTTSSSTRSSVSNEAGSFDTSPSFEPPSAPIPSAAHAARAVTDTAAPAASLTTPAVAAPRDDGSSRSVVPFVFVGLAAVAAGLWTLAGRQSPPPALDAGVNR